MSDLIRRSASGQIIQGDALTVLRTLDDESVQTCVTSPPYYGLRDYGVDGQIGMEETPEQFISALADVFDEVRRVLKPDGTLWVNIGDSYATGTRADRQQSKNPGVGANRIEAQNGVPRIGNPNGCKTKDLIGIPWMLAFELRRRGWYLRQDIIWHKPNPMPESVKDRCTKSHEYIFLLSKSEKYYFDHESMKEKAVYTDVDARNNPPRYGGNKYTATLDKFNRTKSGNAYNYTGFRNKRDVWSVSTKPYKEAHFATYPEELILPCILSGSRKGDTVLDPFNGAGTTGVVCLKNGREYIGVELNPDYVDISMRRLNSVKEIIEIESAQMSLFDKEVAT